MELNRNEFEWTEKTVVGTALLIKGGVIDSLGKKINANVFYEVGKHKETGKVVIFPTEKNMKNEFVNTLLKKHNRFN